MTQDSTGPAPSGGTPAPTTIPQISGRGESVFKGLSAGAAGLIIAAVVAIFGFLLWQAIPSLAANGANFFGNEWDLSDTDNLRFGILKMLIVTVMSSLLALVIAVPVAVGIAIFLTQYAPSRMARPFAILVDLLAAVPSIVFGLWGIKVLAPKLEPVSTFLHDTFGWLFLFADGNVTRELGGTIFTAGIVLAVMILPIITSVTREVFRQTPRGHMEAAVALGATRWEVIRMSVLPYGRSGIVAGSMLGLGRALGETVAVMFILRTSMQNQTGSLFDGGETFASKIANNAAEFNEKLPAGAYIAAGLVLFILTFIVNGIARAIAGSGRR